MILRIATKYLLLSLLIAPHAHAQQQPPHNHADHAGHAHEERPGGSSSVKKEESNVDFFWRRSDEAFHAGDYNRAVVLHRAIVALEPGDLQSWGVASWLLWSLGRGEEALAHIEKGIKANPGSWEMWSEAGNHFDLQKLNPGLPQRSFEAYRRAVELLPADVEKNDAQMLRRRLAHAAEKVGELSVSAQTWRDLVRDFPDQAVNKNNLARVEAKAQAKS